jgi:glycosyltransferase involved in cell wall biosynthesis
MPLAPTVGVVVANHNNSAFVAKAIDSVARQTVRDIRVVVVDDASTDRSDEVIRQCLSHLDDARFRYVRLPSNLGQAGALRRGMAELDTPFVCFLDSDDLWYDAFVARHLAAHMNADFPVALTYCDSHVIDSDDRLLAGTAWWFDSDPSTPVRRTIDPSLMPTIDPETGELTYPLNRNVSFHPQWSPAGATNTTASMMVRRAFVDLVLVAPSDDLRLYVDFYLSTFACLLTGAIAIHEALYAYRMHGQNKHSNATVLGGAYNSSTRQWAPIRTHVLQLVQTVLQREAKAIRTAFGEGRHAEAEALIGSALGNLPVEPANTPTGWMPEGVLAKAAALFGDGLSRLGMRDNARTVGPLPRRRDPS